MSGLQPVTTAQQMADLFTSDASPEVQKDILVTLVVEKQQANEAELRFRLQTADKELAKIRRQLAEKSDEVGTLRGDVRVRIEK